MFDLEKFRTGGYYVHLPTQELYDEAMEFLAKNGFIWGESKTKLKAVNYWIHKEEDTSIIGEDRCGVRYDTEQYYIGEGRKKLELNMEENMEEKIRKDFIKFMFESEFGRAINFIRQYKGRLMFHSRNGQSKFIDFIDHLDKEYDIKGDEVVKVVIESFDIPKHEKQSKEFLELEKDYRLKIPKEFGVNHNGYLYLHTPGIDPVKYEFTQEEIDDLPNQDLIKLLTKEEVE